VTKRRILSSGKRSSGRAPVPIARLSSNLTHMPIVLSYYVSDHNNKLGEGNMIYMHLSNSAFSKELYLEFF
jgi:hypothetical protein